MSLTLIGSFTSPYVRKMRLLLWNDKTLKFHPLNYFEEAGNIELREISPFNQLPILMDGNQPIYETRVMFNYIIKKNNLKSLTIEEENILSAIDVCLNTGINLFSLRKGGVNIDDSSNYFLVRQKERIPSLLKFLIPWAQKQENCDWNFLTMSMLCLIYWFDFREVYNMKQHPELMAFLERFKDCPGVKETLVPA